MSAFGSVSVVGASSPAGVVTGANNGVSESPSGTIVLGNDLAGSAGQLISNREIPQNGFFVRFVSSLDPLGFIAFEEGILRMTGDASVGSFFFVMEDGLLPGFGFSVECGVGNVPGAVSIIGADGGGQTTITMANGDFTANSNGTVGISLIATGGVRFSYKVVPTTGNISLSPGLLHAVYTNEGAAGAITISLPIAAANQTATFYVQNANSLIVDAAAGDTIRWGANVTAAGGSISSNVVGSSITLVCINATEWVAISLIGTWV